MVLKTKQGTRDRKKARKIATPPGRAIGCVWTFLAEGVSNRWYCFANLATRGVRTNDNPNDSENMA